MPTVTPPEQRTVWATLREAVRGSHQDFTEGSIPRAVLLLAVPMVLEMVMESLFALVDVFWVTRLGANALATVGLTESMLALVFSVALGVSFSTTAMVARRVGEKDADGAATAAMQAILLGLGIAIAIGVPACIWAKPLLGMMGGTPELVAGGYGYTAIVFASTPVVMLLFLNNAILRGAGDASAAMRVLWVANLINLVLDPCFIFGLGPFPKLGVSGAAVATMTGRSCGVLYQFWLLTRGSDRLRLYLRHVRVVPAVLGDLIRVSATGVLQFLISHSSWVVLVRIISTLGSTAVAGYTIGIRVFMFVILPSWGLTGAAATMVGQNLGAQKPERAERAVYQTIGYNVIYLVVIAAIMIFLPTTIAAAFSADPNVTSIAADCMRIIGYGNLSYAFGMVFVQAFNGAGDTVTPTLINIVSFWLCEIPLGWFLGLHTPWKERGVFAAIPIANTLMAVLSFIIFARGGWKRRKI